MLIVCQIYLLYYTFLLQHSGCKFVSIYSNYQSFTSKFTDHFLQSSFSHAFSQISRDIIFAYSRQPCLLFTLQISIADYDGIQFSDHESFDRTMQASTDSLSLIYLYYQTYSMVQYSKYTNVISSIHGIVFFLPKVPVVISDH